MHKHLIVVASVLILTASHVPAWALWGCAAKSRSVPYQYGWTHGATSEQATRELALKVCREIGGKGCHILGCDPNIETDEQSRAMWGPTESTTTKIRCGDPGQPKC
jgi:hypothetical protein